MVTPGVSWGADSTCSVSARTQFQSSYSCRWEVNLFRAKLTDDSDEIEPSITIRCRQTYLLAEFAQWEQLQDIGPFDLQLPLAESATDPLPLLTLAAQWSTSDDAFESLETLPHPSSAPVWTVRAQPPLQPTRTPRSCLSPRQLHRWHAIKSWLVRCCVRTHTDGIIVRRSRA